MPLYYHFSEPLDTLNVSELRSLQWELEKYYHHQILNSPSGSQRAEIINMAYSDISQILHKVKSLSNSSPTFGLQERDSKLVVSLLGDSSSKKFFEVGFGLGKLLTLVSRHGHYVSGVEPASSLVDFANSSISRSYNLGLIAGDLLSLNNQLLSHKFDLIYWNDVIEHVHPEDVPICISKLYSLLKPGGSLITITPNWHVRPSDITRLFCPPRTSAQGLHLKEYTLCELCSLLQSSGFSRLRVPFVCTRSRSILLGSGFLRLKLLLEPILELLPIKLARIVAGGLGYYCVIATRIES